jgi:hypothetical protein
VLDRDSSGEGDVKDQLSEEPLPKKKVSKKGGKKKAAMKIREDINAHRNTAPIRQTEVRECC